LLLRLKALFGCFVVGVCRPYAGSGRLGLRCAQPRVHQLLDDGIDRNAPELALADEQEFLGDDQMCKASCNLGIARRSKAD
jgi:hypothetical protein